MKYITLQQVRTYDIGIPVTENDISDMALQRIINTAEANIDGYIGFDPRNGGFEPSSVYFETRWNYQTRKISLPKPYVPLRTITRYQIQMSNITSNGAGYNAIINPGDVAINNFDEYVEIVPLAAITYSVFPAAFGLGLDPPVVHFDGTAGYYLPSWNESLMDSGDHLNFYAQRAFWASSYNQAPATIPYTQPQVPPEIMVNDSQVNSGFTIDYLNGKVTFASQQTQPVSASYCYQIPDVVMEATRDEVFWQLAIRQANQMGMTAAVGQVRSGDQMITNIFLRSGGGDQEALCPSAARKLDAAFGSIAIG